MKNFIVSRNSAFCVVIFTCCNVISLIAQTTNQIIQKALFSQLDKDLKPDFSIPNIPAYAALGIDKSEIPSPSTLRDLTTNLSSLIGKGSLITIPNNFAIEFAPALFFKDQNTTQSEILYVQPGNNFLRFINRTLRRTQLSFATGGGEDSSTANKIAFGLRTSLIDESDKRISEDIDALITSIQSDTSVNSTNARSKVDRDSAIQSQILKTKNIIKSTSNWHNCKLNIAVVWLCSVQDSIGKGLSIQQFLGWISYVQNIAPNAQLTAGVKLTLNKNISGEYDGSLTKGSIAAKLIGGGNNAKGFLELQYSATGSKGIKNGLIDAGVEFAIDENNWITLNAGIEMPEGSRPNYVSNLRYNVSLIDLINKLLPKD